MTDQKTKTKTTDDAPAETIYLDLATREIVRETASGVSRVAPEPATFEFYVATKRYPVRNAG
jgi:hypothetical protein